VFSLSLRDVELILAERGIVVSYETVRSWCKKFDTTFADRLRRRRECQDFCVRGVSSLAHHWASNCIWRMAYSASSSTG
jgi:hypothetical protein